MSIQLNPVIYTISISACSMLLVNTPTRRKQILLRLLIANSALAILICLLKNIGLYPA